MKIDTIYNEDCMITMERMMNEKFLVDLILTSPPYNTSRVGASDKYNSRYAKSSEFEDAISDAGYIDWMVRIFNSYDAILQKNGVVLFNMSYSSENTDLIWMVVANIIHRTNFTTADCIVWKKNSAIPNNRSSNKLTRICEWVFVFVRKFDLDTFNCSKKVVSTIEKTGQENFENIFNFIEAKNNDESVDLNKATFSTDLVRRLLQIYGKDGDWVYDSFMGTGTTALGCVMEKMHYIGSELSNEQVMYAEERIDTHCRQTTLF